MKTMTSKEYIENKGLLCPYCGSTQVITGAVDYCDFGLALPTWCDDCSVSWTEEFILSSVSELE